MTDIVERKYPKGTPGSVEARKIGCSCPVLDNGSGRLCAATLNHRGYITSDLCPVHEWVAGQ